MSTNDTSTMATREIQISEIVVKEQHRRNFDEKKIKDLAGNIGKVGVLQPLLLRTVGTGKALELVAGERRLRAAKLAGLKAVPARIGAWTDQEAAEIQAFENLHRADLTPTEEAHAFKTLLDSGSYDVKSLAQRVDKSEAYVYRALALLELPARIIKEIEAGELTPAHGHQLLRCPPEDRETVYEEWKDDFDSEDKGFTASSLREFVESRQDQDLDKAIFPKNVPYAGQMACAGCGFNSGNQGNLFDGAEKGKCLKAVCFNIKTEAARAEVGEKALKSFPGVQLGGVVERHHTGFPNVKGVIIRKETLENKKLQELLEKSPKKFSVVVAKEQGWGDSKKPEAFLVCKDKEALEKAGVPTETTKKEERHGTAQGETAQQRFIRFETERNIIGAIGKAFTKMERRHWVTIISRLYSAATPRCILESFDIDVSGSGYNKPWEKLLARLSIEQIQMMAVQTAVWPNSRSTWETGWREKDLRAAGLDAPKVVSKAKVDAAAAWKARKGSKGASKKTAKRATREAPAADETAADDSEESA